MTTTSRAVCGNRISMDHMTHPAEGKPLLPCPFCGGKAAIEQHGTMRQSCIIACEDCSCRLETGEVFDMGRAWNTRHSQGAMLIRLTHTTAETY